jgi:Flp pilus assembly protein TadD
LATLRGINALRIPDDFALEAMDRLRNRFLNVALGEVALPLLEQEAQEITNSQQEAANEASPVKEEQLTAQTWFERGYVFAIETKNPEEAVRCFLEAIRLDPNLDAAYNNLGASLDELKRYDEAQAAYRKAIELNPAEATAYSNLIILLRLIRRGEDTIPLLEKLIEIKPEDFNSYLALASIDKQAGRKASEEHLDKARQFLPEEDWYNRACLESVCNNLDQAFEYLEKAAQREQFDPAWAWHDPDLQWIRDDPRFIRIVGAKPK